jgi:hypothetical protein
MLCQKEIMGVVSAFYNYCRNSNLSRKAIIDYYGKIYDSIRRLCKMNNFIDDIVKCDMKTRGIEIDSMALGRILKGCNMIYETLHFISGDIIQEGYGIYGEIRDNVGQIMILTNPRINEKLIQSHAGLSELCGKLQVVDKLIGVLKSDFSKKITNCNSEWKKELLECYFNYITCLPSAYNITLDIGLYLQQTKKDEDESWEQVGSQEGTTVASNPQEANNEDEEKSKCEPNDNATCKAQHDNSKQPMNEQELRVTSQEKRKGYDIWFHIVKRDGNVFITRYDYTGNNFSLDVDQKTFHMSLIFEQTDYNQHNEPVIQGIRYLSPTTIVYYKAE